MLCEAKITLPMPPSVNRLHIGQGAAKRRRPDYSAWLHEAGWRINEARASGEVKNLPADTWYWTDIRLPQMHLGDSDNRLKAIHDLLHQMRLTPDDKWLLGGTYMRCADVDEHTCVVAACAVEESRLSRWEQIRMLADRMVAAEQGKPMEGVTR